MKGTGITKKDLEWINKVVDSNKRIRSEVTRDRVKILMMAAMTWKLHQIELESHLIKTK